MAKHTVEEMKKWVRIYIAIFMALMVLTIVTVAISFYEFQGRYAVAIGIAAALFIATIKSSLVAGFFMHLISEKKLIFIILVLTVIFFIGLMFLPLLTDMNHVRI